MAEVTMPRLSDTMQEGTIAKWLKQPGDQVARGDVIAQIETDKATMDLVAYDAGTLSEVLAQEGSTVAIGEPVARIGGGGGSAPAAPAADAASTAPAAQEEAAVATPGGEATGSVAPQTQEARESVAEAPEPTGSAAPVSARPGSQQTPAAPARPAEPASNGSVAGKVRASPLARRIAEEHGINLASLRGTGPEGRVIRADVEAALQGAGATAAPQAQPAPDQATQVATQEGDERVPLTSMRRVIARRMTESTTTVPHFFLTSTVDATELVALRKQVVAQLEGAGEDVKVSLNDFVMRASALALRRVPEMNASFTPDAIVRHARVHVGFAVALEQGLVVPVIRDADTRSVSQIAREAKDLAARARAGKLQPADYSGGTFSVSNLGMFGIEQFNAVINPPEAGILAVGAVLREPAEHNGEIALRERMRLTLSIDHRTLDGATGARFLQELKRLLENPLLLLI